MARSRSTELSRRLLQAQDQERRRIARELHDTTGQKLTALQIKLSLVAHSAGKLDPNARQELAESIALARACAIEIRTCSYLLYPPLLDELGLLPALRNYVEEYAQRTGVRVDLEIPEQMERLPQEVEIALFRIVQEGLTNIHRHSESPKTVLRLKTGPGSVILELTGHGHGMPSERAGAGMGGMRELARQLGGRFSIRSGAEGTRLRVQLPV
jgi:two-component system NarL family sensor kinase